AAASRSRGSMPPATSSGCSFITTRPAPDRPAMPCSAISPAAAPVLCSKRTDDQGGHTMAKAPAAHGPRAIEKLAEWTLAPRHIPAAAVNQAKLLTLDAIGCGFA